MCMEGNQALNDRQMKIVLLCENIPLVISWLFWIIFSPFWIHLLIILFWSCPVIIDETKFLMRIGTIAGSFNEQNTHFSTN